MGDAFGLDLALSPVLVVLGRGDVGVHERVGGLVKGRLGGLGGGDIGRDHDSLVVVAGVAVESGPELVVLDGPALASEPVGHGLGDAGGVVAAEPVGVGGVLGDRLGSLDGVGLGEVEDGHGEESRAASLGLLAGGLVLDGFGDLAAAEDTDAALTFADLPAELLPGAVPRDLGRVLALGEDQEQVVQAVAVELPGEGEELGPCFRGGQGLNLLGDGLVQFGRFGAALLGGLVGLDLPGHGVGSFRVIGAVRANCLSSLTFFCH